MKHYLYVSVTRMVVHTHTHSHSHRRLALYRGALSLNYNPIQVTSWKTMEVWCRKINKSVQLKRKDDLRLD